jgi:hypothetical protein
MGLCCDLLICEFSRYAATSWVRKLVISRFRRYAATRRQMAFPALDEVLAVVALGYCGWAGTVVTAADTEGVQQAGQIGGVQWLALVPFMPGTVLEVVKMIEQGGC